MWQKKVCLIGDFCVGKTSLVRRYVEGSFSDHYLSTIGVKVDRKPVMLGDAEHPQALNLILWDIAGGNGREVVSKHYLRGAAGAVVVCDLTRSETLESMRWHAQTFLEVNPTAALVFVGNKADLTATRKVTLTELKLLACEFSAACYESSAKTGQNVEDFFFHLSVAMLREDHVTA